MYVLIFKPNDIFFILVKIFINIVYDFNNNKAGFLAETSASIVFDGAPQILADGTDGLLTGSVFLGNTTGSGIELHGGSAYMRSLGYDGFNDTISNLSLIHI